MPNISLFEFFVHMLLKYAWVLSFLFVRAYIENDILQIQQNN